MSGRTCWLAKDADWHLREWIVDLGTEFGPVGPLAIDWLECAAKRQNDGGHVKAGLKALARGVYADVVTVGHVVSRAVTLCLLVEYEEHAGVFTCRISWWKGDQEKALAATRKARQRAVNTEDSASLSRSVTESHVESQNVTLTGQDRSKERTNVLSSTRTSSTELEKSTDDDRASCRLFYSLGRERNPKMKIPGEGSGEHASALKAMRLLRERDEQSTADIQTLIRWLFTDPSDDAVFWGTTIQAPSGLRKNFSKVWSKMAAQSSVVVPFRNNRKQSASDLLRALDAADAAEQEARNVLA